MLSKRSFIKSLLLSSITLPFVPSVILKPKLLQQSFNFPPGYNCGLVFPIIKNNKNNYEITSIPVRNNPTGWNIAKDIEKSPNFHKWAVNPWKL